MFAILEDQRMRFLEQVHCVLDLLQACFCVSEVRLTNPCHILRGSTDPTFRKGIVDPGNTEGIGKMEFGKPT